MRAWPAATEAARNGLSGLGMVSAVNALRTGCTKAEIRASSDELKIMDTAQRVAGNDPAIPGYCDTSD